MHISYVNTVATSMSSIDFGHTHTHNQNIIRRFDAELDFWEGKVWKFYGDYFIDNVPALISSHKLWLYHGDYISKMLGISLDL